MNRVVLAVCILLCLPLVITAQKKPVVTTSALQTRTFDNQPQRIAVLIALCLVHAAIKDRRRG